MGYTAAAICVALLFGCGPAGVPEPPADEHARQASVAPDPLPPTVEAFAWDCDDGTAVVSEYDGDADEMWLFLPAETVKLSHLEAASGAKFGNDTVVFWNKGEEALLEVDGASRKCSINRFRSNLESIKLSGGDFWATGNEPGWSLVIYPEWMVFTTGYGEERHEVVITDRSEDPSTQPYVFRGSAADQALVVGLRGGPCFDSMSGEEFETVVEIDLGEQHFSGCGMALH